MAELHTRAGVQRCLDGGEFCDMVNLVGVGAEEEKGKDGSQRAVKKGKGGSQRAASLDSPPPAWP